MSLSIQDTWVCLEKLLSTGQEIPLQSPWSVCMPGHSVWMSHPWISIPPSRVNPQVPIAGNIEEQNRSLESPKGTNMEYGLNYF